MLKVGMLLILALASVVQASEFSHIKLSPKFEKHLTGSASPTQKTKLSARALGLSTEAETDFNSLLLTALLGGGNRGIPVDGEESPLYQEIRLHLEGSHAQIGLEEVTRLDRINRQYNLGTQNFSGFSWQKPFGTVQVWVDRQVIPNLETTGPQDTWYVQDTFNIEIEGSTFLERLKEAGLADMSEVEIAAFAGITFKRVYTYISYAESYEKGLQTDFTKLFLPFLYYGPAGLERMAANDIIKRHDSWSASAGGLITTPPLYNIAFSAGVLAQATFEQTTSVQSLVPQEPNLHRYEVGVMNKDSKSAGATLSLQLDFFKLLKLTLLRGDLTYEFSAGKKFTLGLSQQDMNHLFQDEAQKKEFETLFQGKSEIKALEPYVVRLEESESESIDASGSALLWGKLQHSKTEHKRIIKDGTVNVFYKSYSQSTKYVQNLLSRLISAVVYKLLKLPIGTKNVAIYSKQIQMEHKVTGPQAENPSLLRVEATEDFSFTLIQSYEASSTHRTIDSQYRNDVIWFIDEFTTLPKDYKNIIKSNQLRGPLKVESNLKVNHEGFKALLAKSTNDLFTEFVRICKSGELDLWKNERERKKLLKERLTGPDACVQTLGVNYLEFREDYDANDLKPSLAKFKNFLGKYYKASESITDLHKLFGTETTFLSGTLNATYPSGESFRDHFSNGLFRGNGVIDNFIRSNGTRTPASVQNE